MKPCSLGCITHTWFIVATSITNSQCWFPFPSVIKKRKKQPAPWPNQGFEHGFILVRDWGYSDNPVTPGFISTGNFHPTSRKKLIEPVINLAEKWPVCLFGCLWACWAVVAWATHNGSVERGNREWIVWAAARSSSTAFFVVLNRSRRERQRYKDTIFFAYLPWWHIIGANTQATSVGSFIPTHRNWNCWRTAMWWAAQTMAERGSPITCLWMGCSCPMQNTHLFTHRMNVKPLGEVTFIYSTQHTANITDYTGRYKRKTRRYTRTYLDKCVISSSLFNDQHKTWRR